MTVIGNQMAEDLRRCCDALLAERDQLRTRVQELGAMARENRSRAAVELEAEMDKLRADARRYQWLRDKANDVQQRAPMAVMVDSSFSVSWRDALYGSSLDAAIDQAMSTTMPSGGAL